MHPQRSWNDARFVFRPLFRFELRRYVARLALAMASPASPSRTHLSPYWRRDSIVHRTLTHSVARRLAAQSPSQGVQFFTVPDYRRSAKLLQGRSLVTNLQHRKRERKSGTASGASRT